MPLPIGLGAPSATPRKQRQSSGCSRRFCETTAAPCSARVADDFPFGKSVVPDPGVEPGTNASSTHRVCQLRQSGCGFGAGGGIRTHTVLVLSQAPPASWATPARCLRLRRKGKRQFDAGAHRICETTAAQVSAPNAGDFPIGKSVVGQAGIEPAQGFHREIYSLRPSPIGEPPHKFSGIGDTPIDGSVTVSCGARCHSPPSAVKPVPE